MRTKKTGFSLIEILVIIIVITFLAGMLFPLLNRHHHGNARQTTCTSNLRQLAMAVTMYSQDNKNHLPGIYKRNDDGTFSSAYTGWAGNLITYVKGGTDVTSSNEMLFCPEMMSNLEIPISYGYNGCILKTDGTGISEDAIKQPTQVGVLCDAEPGIPYPAVGNFNSKNIYGGGGIIGGYSLVFNDMPALEKMGAKLTVTPIGRHHGSVVVGYADGHASSIPDIDTFNVKDSLSGVVRAFYMCSALGLVDNPAGGLGGPIDHPFGEITPAVAGKTNTVIGGDAVTRPLLMAACEAAKRTMTGFNYKTDGFKGSLNTKKRPADYLEGVAAYGIPPASIGRQTSCVQIGVDAMVVVVNKNCPIKTGNIDLTTSKFSRTGGNGKWRVITFSDLQAIIQSDGYGMLDNIAKKSRPANVIADSHDWQLYLQNKTDGSRKVIAAPAATFSTPGGFGTYYKDGGYVGQAGYIQRYPGSRKKDADTFRGTYCKDDIEIVDKVANDVLGIGIVSAAFADMKKIDILAISFGTPATTATFPTSNIRQDPGVYPPTCTWQFRCNLYAYYTPGKASEAVAALSFTTYQSVFMNGPLYKASFWPPTGN